MAKLLIREICQHKKISLTALADSAGLSRISITKIADGSQNATLATLEQIAQALDVELVDLISSEAREGSLTCPACGARLSVNLSKSDR